MDDITSGGCLKKEQIRRGRVQIAKNPFAKGVERVAFYGRVLSFYEEKKPKHIVLKRYFGQKGFVNSAKQCESAIQLQTIAAFMATKFNDELLKKVCPFSIIALIMNHAHGPICASFLAVRSLVFYNLLHIVVKI